MKDNLSSKGLREPDTERTASLHCYTSKTGKELLQDRNKEESQHVFKGKDQL